MPDEETQTEETTEPTTDGVDNSPSEGGLDKFRQQIQQELGNKFRPLEGLADQVSALTDKIEMIASTSTSSKEIEKAENALAALDDIEDGEFVEGKDLRSVLTGVLKKVEALGEAKLPEGQARILEEVQRKQDGEKAWIEDQSWFASRHEDLSDRYDEFTDSAIDEIQKDDSLDMSDLKGLREGLVRQALAKGGRPRKSTTGTKVTRTGASTTSSKGTPERDGVLRDSNDIPVMWTSGE